jgi:uncharacterized membrane protein
MSKTVKKAAVTTVAPKPARLVTKAGAKVAGAVLPAAARAVRAVMRGAAPESMLARARTLPIQRSVDVGVPIDVAWDHWMEFQHMPEGTHRVADIEREDGHLYGRLEGVRANSDWEAEIVDERIDESFAWHSVGGSDCSGLLTFHELSERLTRLELYLDVIPGGVGDAVALMLRIADRRAETELRHFKAELEALDPDEWPPPPGQEEPESVDDDDKED